MLSSQKTEMQPDSNRSSLNGKRIVVTRARNQSADLLHALENRGALAMAIPMILVAPPEDFAPLDNALGRLETFDWILFTSANTVRAVAERACITGATLGRGESGPRIAAVGPATATEAQHAGFVVTYVAKNHSGGALGEELGEDLRGRSVLLPRSDRANPDLPLALKNLGAKATEVIVYRTLPPHDIDWGHLDDALRQADAVLFFSPSAAHHLSELIGREAFLVLGQRAVFVAIGLTTTGALKEMGMQHIVTASDTTTSAVIASLVEHFAKKSVQSSPAGVGE
jgi:uroporphyrinogen-III synthase